VLIRFFSPFTPLPPVQFGKFKADNTVKRARLELMSSQKNNRSRKWRSRIILILAVSILSVVLLHFYYASSPEGVYYDPDLACGYGVWIFKESKIFIQCDNESPKETGIYIKSGNRWVAGKSGGVLKPSILGITMYDPSLTKGHVFWFRSRFSWIVNCGEWFQRRF